MYFSRMVLPPSSQSVRIALRNPSHSVGFAKNQIDFLICTCCHFGMSSRGRAMILPVVLMMDSFMLPYVLLNFILDIKSWMTEDFLQLNQDNTEVLIAGPED